MEYSKYELEMGTNTGHSDSKSPALKHNCLYTKKKRKKRETLAHVYRCYENNIWQSIILLAVVISYFSRYTHTQFIFLYFCFGYMEMT